MSLLRPTLFVALLLPTLASAETPCVLATLDVHHAPTIRGERLPIRMQGSFLEACTTVDLDLGVDGAESVPWTVTSDSPAMAFEAVLDVELEPGSHQLQVSVPFSDDVWLTSEVFRGEEDDLEVAVFDEGDVLWVEAAVGASADADLVCTLSCANDDGLVLHAAIEPVLDGFAALELPSCGHPALVSCRALGAATDTGAVGTPTTDLAAMGVEIDPVVLDEIAAAQPFITLRDLLHAGEFEGRLEGLGGVGAGSGLGRLHEVVIRTTGMGRGRVDVPMGPPTGDGEGLLGGAMPGAPEGERSPGPFGPDTVPDLFGLSPTQRAGVVMGPGWSNAISALRTPGGGGMPTSSTSGPAVGWSLKATLKAGAAALSNFAVGAAGSVVGAFDTVVSGVISSHDDTLHGCEQMAGDAKKDCEEDTDKASESFKEHDDHKNMCNKAFEKRPSRQASCRRKAKKKNEELCKRDPKHQSCKKPNNNNNNNNNNNSYCDGEDPSCSDGPGPIVDTSSNLEAMRTRIDLCGPARPTETETCESVQEVPTEAAIQSVCRHGEIGGDCKRVTRVKPAAIPDSGDIDPVDPDDME